jgi:hypothetical protein
MKSYAVTSEYMINMSFIEMMTSCHEHLSDIGQSPVKNGLASL